MFHQERGECEVGVRGEEWGRYKGRGGEVIRSRDPLPQVITTTHIHFQTYHDERRVGKQGGVEGGGLM